MSYPSVTRSAASMAHVPPAATSASLPNVPPFPVDVLPAPVREYIESAKLLNYPIDVVATVALTGMASTIGDTHRLEVKYGWQEPPILFAAIIGDAGMRKTPALNYSLAPLRKREFKRHQHNQQEQESYRQELGRWKRAKCDDEPPVEPRAEQGITENFTPEALIALLHANPRGLLCVRDELASWTRDMNRYNPGSDEQLWLSMWSAQPMMYNRKSQGERLFVPRPVVNVIGGIQPGVVQELFGAGKNVNGFSDRILFAYPDPIERHYVAQEVDIFVRERYERVYERLFELDWTQDEEGQPTPKVVKLSPDAQQRFIDWDESFINAQMNDPDVPNQEKSVLSKLEGYALRLTLILHLVECACGESHGLEVKASTVEGALRVTEYFAAHKRKVLALVGQPLTDTRGLVLAQIKARGGEITKRDLCRNKLGGLNTQEKASAFFRETEALGLGTISIRPTAHGGPATEVLTLLG